MVSREKLNSIRFFYKGFCFSDEPLIRDYANFLYDNIFNERFLLTLHFDSAYFDILNIFYSFLYIADKNLTKDFDFSVLNEGDLVLHRFPTGRQYVRKWVGITEEDGVKIAVMKEYEGKKVEGSTVRIDLDRIKNCITLYNGSENKTGPVNNGGRHGMRSTFLSYIFDLNEQEIPQTFLHTFETIVDKQYFEDIISNTVIEFGIHKIRLLDLFQCTYETMNGNLKQFTDNPAKVNNLFIYTDKISTARDRLLNNNNGVPFSLLVLKDLNETDNTADFQDLIDYEDVSEKIIVSSEVESRISKYIFDQDVSPTILAYTPDRVKGIEDLSESSGFQRTRHFKACVSRAIKPSINIVNIKDSLTKDDYKYFTNKIKMYNASSLSESDKELYRIYIRTTLKLINTLCFPIEAFLENSSELNLSQNIRMLDDCIADLKTISNDSELVEKIEKYSIPMLKENKKYDEILNIIKNNPDKQITIVVEKAYYKTVLEHLFKESDSVTIKSATEMQTFRNPSDIIIITCSLLNKHINLRRLSGIADVYILLYENENIPYNRIIRNMGHYDKKLNLRLSGIKASSEEYKKELEEETYQNDDDTEKNYLEDYNDFANIDTTNLLRTYRNQSSGYFNGSLDSECEYVGILSGEQKIAFSKFYSAYVYNENTEQVIIKKPEELQVGDNIIFTKRYSSDSDIINKIFVDLYNNKILSEDLEQTHINALRWKSDLISYYEKHGRSMKSIYYALRRMGYNFSYVAIQNWLKNPNMTGPHEPITLKIIGELTNDEELIKNYEKYYEDIRTIRSQRLKIIKLVADVIRFSYSKTGLDKIENDKMLKKVHEYVSNQSEILQLEQIIKLDKVERINTALVNRPISI